ncbi:glutathione S-transferase theta-1b [Pholidichthys leucotaenia]
MALELYLDLLSQPCRAVYIFAKKNNIPFEFKELSLLHGDQFEKDYEKVNPIGKVPALKDGDFCLTESIAIMLYLAQKFQAPEFWFPADLQQRARVNEYLSWQHTGIRMHGSKIFWFKVLIPKVFDMELPKDKLDLALKDLNASLKVMEEKFLQDRPFIAGDQMTLADLVAIVEVMQPVGAGVDVFEGRPKLSAWRDRVQATIGKELFDETHEGIVGAREKVKAMDGSRLEIYKEKMKQFM